MLSPARRHVMRVQAEESAQLGGSPSRNLSGYNLMLLQLEEDLRRLKGVQSNEKRGEMKRDMLPKYAPWVTGAMEKGRGAQDDVLMTIMIWRVDAGDYDGALQIAAYALQYDLVLPKRFGRKTACAIAEEIADEATKAYAAKRPVDVDLLRRTMDLTASHDMPDEVRAKLHKIIGFGMRDNNQPVLALDHLNRAFELNANIGVKQDIRQLVSAINKASKA
ncbi:hypothetical protein A8A01_21035 [Ewingella americana]|nr:hypothetical protein A8A01_21035 [Ewingella americana]